LRVGRNARKSHGVTVFIQYFVAVLIFDVLFVTVFIAYRSTGDYTRNVSAVVRIRRINVGVVIGVVVCERNFRVIVNFVYRYVGIFRNKTFARIAVENSFRDGRFVEHFYAGFFFGHRLKRRVRVVETGIENRDYHAASVVALIA